MNTKTLRKIKKEYIGWAYASPCILGFLIFTIFPLITSLVISFSEYDFFNPIKFVGLDQYEKMFTIGWPEIVDSAKTTFVYAFFSTVIGISTGFVFALFCNSKYKGMAVFRVFYYLPSVIPFIASGLLSRDIFSPDMGVMNTIFTKLGLPQSQFYSGEDSALPTMILSMFLSFGGSMVMWLAYLKRIPTELYESAQLDGAGKVRSTFAITIPMTTPMFFYSLVINTVGSLQVFQSAYVLSSGGVGKRGGLNFIVGYIYNYAFKSYNFGYAAAVSWLLFAFIGGLTFLIFKTDKYWVNYD